MCQKGAELALASICPLDHFNLAIVRPLKDHPDLENYQFSATFGNVLIMAAIISDMSSTL